MQTESSRLNVLHIPLFLVEKLLGERNFGHTKHTKAPSSTYLQILVLQNCLDPDKNGFGKVE